MERRKWIEIRTDKKIHIKMKFETGNLIKNTSVEGEIILAQKQLRKIQKANLDFKKT